MHQQILSKKINTSLDVIKNLEKDTSEFKLLIALWKWLVENRQDRSSVEQLILLSIQKDKKRGLGVLIAPEREH